MATEVVMRWPELTWNWPFCQCGTGWRLPDFVRASRRRDARNAVLQYRLCHLPRFDTVRFTGPLQVLSRLPQSATYIVAKSAAPVPSDCGLGLVPTHTFANCLPLDLIW